jgi:arginase family enzyme
MPSTGTTANNGLTMNDISQIIDITTKHSKIICIDLVEFNPLIGTKNQCRKTLQNIITILHNFLKNINLGNNMLSC